MNVLVDTSVWVDHLRKGDARLAKLLNDGRVLCHPFVIGELACGNLNNRFEILDALKELSFAPTIEFEEYMQFIELNRLRGIGIGFVDVNLLASALLADSALWTADKKLNKAALDLGIAYPKTAARCEP
jgi:predicted nucleic acid-binding protein